MPPVTPLSQMEKSENHPEALKAINDALQRLPVSAKSHACEECEMHMLVRQMDLSGSTADGFDFRILSEVLPSLGAAAKSRLPEAFCSSTVAYDIDGTCLNPPRTTVHKNPCPRDCQLLYEQTTPTATAQLLASPQFLPTDVDFMLELTMQAQLEAPVGDTDSPASGSGYRCVAVSSTRKPGYYRLLRPLTASCKHSVPLPLPAEGVRHALRDAVVSILGGGTEVILNGPAVTFSAAGRQVDLVTCLRLPWPPHWREQVQRRPRPAGWPADALLEQLPQHLLLVPVGPSDDDTQHWRLSFSPQEALLARALPLPARLCLASLRMARRTVRTPSTLLCSYHLKTAVLWMCERWQPEQWQNLPQSMLALLTWLQERLSDRHLPCYLLPAISVLRDSTAARVQKLEEDLQLLRDYLCQNGPPLLSVYSPLCVSGGSFGV